MRDCSHRRRDRPHTPATRSAAHVRDPARRRRASLPRRMRARQTLQGPRQAASGESWERAPGGSNRTGRATAATPGALALKKHAIVTDRRRAPEFDPAPDTGPRPLLGAQFEGAAASAIQLPPAEAAEVAYA